MSDGEIPRISVIVAVYNGAVTLERCLDSFSRQSYSNKELILMDGGSTDRSVEIIRANESVVTYWESERDRGIYHAWNKALDHATGDWICFLGCDDRFWADDVLEHIAPHLAAAYPPVRVVYGTAAVMNALGEVVRYNGCPWEEAREGFLYTQTIPHPGTMHHRSLFERHGRFDESFRIAGDYDLTLRELKNGQALFVPNLVTVGFQHGGVSNSPAAMSAMLKELARIREKHAIRHPWTRRYSKVMLKMTVSALAYRMIGDRGFRTTADALRRIRGKRPAWRT